MSKVSTQIISTSHIGSPSAEGHRDKWPAAMVKFTDCEEFARMANFLHEGVWIIDANANTTYVNNQMASMLGYLSEEMIGKHLFDFMDEKGGELCQWNLNRREQGIGEQHDFEFIHKDGQRIFALITTTPLQDENGSYVGAIAGVLDITPRRQAQEAYKNLVEESLQGLAIIQDRCIAFANPAFARILGYTVAELVDLSEEQVRCLIYEEDRERVWQRHMQRIEVQLAPESYETRMVCKDGTIRWLDVSVTVLEYGNRPCVQVACLDITEYKQMEDLRKEYQTKLKALASELTLTEERLKRDVATLLHDRISQPIAMSKMKLSALSDSIADDQTLKVLTDVTQTLAQTLTESRMLTSQLSYPVLQVLGLETAIRRWLAEEVQEKHGISTRFVSDGQAKPLDEDICAVLFRGVRELLTNVIKHAHASEVVVTMERENQRVCICVTDNSQGCVVDGTFLQDNHFGLMSVQEALERLGGRLVLDTGSEQGLSATLRAPLKENHD